MKKVIYSTLIISLILASCKKKTETITPAKTDTPTTLSINFNNKIGADPIVFSDMKYTNAANNMYSVTLLKYYVSNAVLKGPGIQHKLNNYSLIDASDLNTCTINAGTVPNGTYDSITFYIGIDPSRNHNGAQDGDLDPAKGMIWDWNTGYIFFKHEGQYKNSANQTKSIIFHYGTDVALASVTIPINLIVSANLGKKTMVINFDLNSVYASPNTIDFNVNNNHQSSSSSDLPWIAKTKTNISDAFKFDKVE